MEASNGFNFLSYDYSNSRCFLKFREDSMSSEIRFFQAENPLPFGNQENTINFSQLPKYLCQPNELPS